MTETAPSVADAPALDVLAADALASDPLASDPDDSSVRTVTPRHVWRQLRLPLTMLLVVALTAFGMAYFRQRVRSGELDPSSVSPAGSRALAQLLEQRGIRVSRLTALSELSATPQRTTIFVPFAGGLPTSELRSLLSSPVSGVNVVLVGASGALDVQGVPLTGSPGAAPGVRAPGCAFSPAVTADRIDAGGVGYEVGAAALTSGAGVDSCYAVDGSPSVVNVERNGVDVTLVGSSLAFTNDRLDEEGNAAFALALLDRGAPVTWLMRRPAGAAPPEEAQGLLELLPDGVYWGLLQLIIAAAVAMLWRGRRLGPVVTEALPVVVRAAEAVEGRGRLYAAAKARGRASWNLRRGARTRLRSRLTLPPDAGNDAIVESAATRSGRAPADIGRLLYGPDPVDDAGLVRLAADLDHLDSEVRRS